MRMKWGIGVVAFIILCAVYYFWQQSHFESRGNVTPVVRDVREPVPPREQKQIPPNAVMEDGTLE